ncbi:Fc.00g035790.m01.CDS01 [Cosmosporella sp. VM-42]
MAHAPDSEAQKRKRDVNDTGVHLGRSHHTSPVTTNQSGNPSFINYLPKSAASAHLSLIEGDGDTFADIISLIAEYESVLDRQESLAASLGAKLTGPRVLRGIEKFFDGPIKTIPIQQFSDSVSWIDVVSFARAHPQEFVLTKLADGSRCCQFVLKGTRVEIAEDDWRLIWSGALDRFPLDHPFEEDETAELATLDILEQRTSTLYKKADEVAARARILNHRLGTRRQDLRRHRNTQDAANSRSQSMNSSQAHRSIGFGSSYDLHADLLQQFIAASATPPHSRSTSGAGVALANMGRGSPGYGTPHTSIPWSNSPPPPDPYRIVVAQKVDQVNKGEPIIPPCDRCRRLRHQCIKHLTACLGCTKKHAKCSWKSLTEEEVAQLKRDIYGAGDMEAALGLPSLRDTPVARAGERQEGETISDAVTPRTTVTEDGSRPPSRGEVRPATTLEPANQPPSKVDSGPVKRKGIWERYDRDRASRNSEQSQLTQLPPIATMTTLTNAQRPEEGSANGSSYQPSSSL